MRRWILLLLPVVFFTVSAAAAAPSPAPTPSEILVKAKAAMGGNAWDQVRAIRSEGRLETSGLKGTLRSLEDTSTGASVSQFDLGVAKGANGFDGKVSWSQDASGVSRDEGDPGSRRQAANDAFLACRAYWYPERWPAEIQYGGLKQEGGRRFQLLKILPRGGYPFELWVDESSGLFDRISQTRDGVTETTFNSEYREVEGIKLPFSVRSTKGEAQYDTVIRLEKVTLNEPLRSASFAMPAPPPVDFGIEGGKQATVIPFRLIGDHVYIQVKLNGQGPFTVFLDTGGVNIVSPALAKALGSKVEGTVQGGGLGAKSESFGVTKVAKIEVGDAWMTGQSFYVVPAMEELMKGSGVHGEGILGYELLRRFVARVDYTQSRLTLFDGRDWKYQGQGFAVPFVFNGHHPQVEGQLDGIPGRFDIDTGSSGTLDVYAPFAALHDLAAKAKVSYRTFTGAGVGGRTEGTVIRARELRLGGASMSGPIVALSSMTQGATANSEAAGNVGTGFLKRFDITLDYRHQNIYFEPNALHDLPDTWNKSGLVIDPSDPGFTLIDILVDSPAAKAGLRKGDQLLAINGVGLQKLTWAGYRAQVWNAPSGTRMEIKVRSGKVERTVSLVLQDLL